MKKLWLSFYLPNLSLEVVERGTTYNQPLVITDLDAGQQWVLAANSVAQHCGIRPGMLLSAAYALTDKLHVKAREMHEEKNALHRLALWANQFTPTISIAHPQALLLEISGCIQLFGGIKNLLQKAHHDLQKLGYTVNSSIAPTPATSLLLARAAANAIVLKPADITRSIIGIYIDFLCLPTKVMETLKRMGIRTVGDCLRLPRDGLARRFGQEFVEGFDKLLGNVADPQELFEIPPIFESKIALPIETCETQALLFAAHRILIELNGYLLAKGEGVQQLEWKFIDTRHRLVNLSIKLVSATNDIKHLMILLRERLEQLNLSAPIIDVELTVKDFLPLVPQNHSLLPGARRVSESWQALIERLQSRLGEQSVVSLRAHADYRPEHAWSYCSAGEKRINPVFPMTGGPCWLLEKPVHLPSKQSQIYFKGRVLKKISHAQRIASGWWDEKPIARDYYIAEDEAGCRFWVFQEQQTTEWFLHGYF